MDGPLPIELFTNNLVHFNQYSLLGNNIGDNDLVVTGKERNTFVIIRLRTVNNCF